MTIHNYRELAKDLKKKGIHNKAVLEAIALTPRHRFMDPDLQDYAMEDSALPIDCEQTISQPYVVARMTEIILAGREKLEKVLEIGTGSGYQAAILSQVVKEVYSIERIATLHHRSKTLFSELSLNNIHTLYSDGNLGWPEHAPYDAILVTAATAEIPTALLEQLAIGGRMVIPLGQARLQTLTVITRDEEGYTEEAIEGVVFVPLLTGLR